MTAPQTRKALSTIAVGFTIFQCIMSTVLLVVGIAVIVSVVLRLV